MESALLIIGAGPAGLLAAWTAAQFRPPGGVRVLDRLPVAGAKLAVTGGGRGNLSHVSSEEAFAAAFGKQGRFTIPAFRSLPPEDLCAFFQRLGAPTTVDEAGRIYPQAQSAAAVRDALFAACKKAGVEFALGQAVKTLVPPAAPGRPWRVDDRQARAVLLAAGGQSAAHLGSDGSGFALARGLGHDVVHPVPALAPLPTVERWPAQHSGLSLPDVTLSLPGKPGASVCGEILFTHRGLSGPAVLNLSGRVARRLQSDPEARLELRLLPKPPDFRRLRQSAGTRSIAAWLAQRVPRSLADTLLDLAGIPAGLTFSRLSAAQETALCRQLTALTLTVRATGGFAESMVTAGGVALKQVRPDTLESRLHPGLYFAGEILDLDGPTGGWNLQWAFCSGHLAGTCAARG